MHVCEGEGVLEGLAALRAAWNPPPRPPSTDLTWKQGICQSNWLGRGHSGAMWALDPT